MPAQPLNALLAAALLGLAAPLSGAAPKEARRGKPSIPHVIPVSRGPGFVERRNLVNARLGRPPYKPSVSRTRLGRVQVIVLEEPTHDEDIPAYAIIPKPEGRAAALAELRRYFPERPEFRDPDTGLLVTLDEHLDASRLSAKNSHGIVKHEPAKHRAEFEQDREGADVVLYLYLKTDR